MGFKIEKKVEKASAQHAGPWAIAGAVFFLLFLSWGLAQAYFPQFDPCPTCEGTGVLSCGAPGCVHGKVPCTGDCLKKDDPRWQPMDVEGHPATDRWIRFDNPDGSWSAWNQGHIGHTIELVGNTYQDTGVCKLCGGTGLMPCPVCHGKNFCPRCNGTGRLRRWFIWF